MLEFSTYLKTSKATCLLLSVRVVQILLGLFLDFLRLLFHELSLSPVLLFLLLLLPPPLLDAEAGSLARFTRLLCEFQWFLIALSVRPSMCRAISAHLLPKFSCSRFNKICTGMWGRGVQRQEYKKKSTQ